MARVPRLLLIEPAGVRRELPITATPFRIGRQAGSELTLRDSRISRQQAQIVSDDGALYLEDLDSRHGTFVNGQKIGRHALCAEDEITFGIPDSFRLVFLGEEATLGELLQKVEAAPQAPGSSRELHHLALLLEVARTLNSGLSLEDVLSTVLDAAIRVTHTERGVLLLVGAGGRLEVTVARDSKGDALDPSTLQISSGVLKRVATTRRELIVGDTGEESLLAQHESVARLELHTVIAVPLEKLPVIEAVDVTVSARQAELLGVLYLDSHLPSTAFSEVDREVLHTLANEAATVIENARLFAAARVKARMDHELEIASAIQQRLQPKAFPELPHLAVAGSMLACRSVGGDCFDVFPLSGDRYGFFVGDVAGKGVSAALLAALLQGVFYTTATLNLPPAEVAVRVNQYLCQRSSEEHYATVFYGVIDLAGRLEYINAGQVSPLIRRASGEVEELTSGNFPVGMFSDASYSWACISLAPGDFLVIYTDGVTEARNREEELYGEARLEAALKNFAGKTVEEMAEAIRSSVREFTCGASQADDITLMVLHYRGPGS